MVHGTAYDTLGLKRDQGSLNKMMIKLMCRVLGDDDFLFFVGLAGKPCAAGGGYE